VQREYAALMRLVATATFLATPVGGGDGSGGGSGSGSGGGVVSSLHAAAELERMSTLLRTAQDNLQTINTKVRVWDGMCMHAGSVIGDKGGTRRIQAR
jgi:hypothetical protein